MTTDGLRKPGEMAETAAGVRDGHGRRAEGGPARTVPVIPLWDRKRTGARG